jgi:26S proteasome non-ATPase regulatory subunit 9
MNSLPPTTYTFNITSREQLANTPFSHLTKYKSEIDTDLNILFNYLQNILHANMETPLLTLDGFPRSDIDVAAIRICRAKIIKLQNDYKWINETLLDKIQLELSKNNQLID